MPDDVCVNMRIFSLVLRYSLDMSYYGSRYVKEYLVWPPDYYDVSIVLFVSGSLSCFIDERLG